MKVSVIALGLALLASSAHAAPADENVCNSSAGKDVLQCEADGLKSLNKQLDRAYKAALLQRPLIDESDQRKSQAQLIKSQKAWKAYVEANCDYHGGVNGGANDWVTIFSLECQEDETKKRIQFLKTEN